MTGPSPNYRPLDTVSSAVSDSGSVDSDDADGEVNLSPVETLGSMFRSRILRSISGSEYVLHAKTFLPPDIKWLFLTNLRDSLKTVRVKEQDVISGKDLVDFLISENGGVAGVHCAQKAYKLMYWNGGIRRAFTDKLEKQKLKADDKHFYKIIPASCAKLRMEVFVIEARNLLGKDRSGFSDPFVSLSMNGQSVETTVYLQTLNPRWNERFDFGVESDEDALELTVWDWNLVAENDFLGKYVLRVDEIRKMAAEDRSSSRSSPSAEGSVEFEAWFPLQKRSARSNVQGDIKLRCRIYHIDSLLQETKREEVEIEHIGFISRTAQRILSSLNPFSSSTTTAAKKLAPPNSATAPRSLSPTLSNRGSISVSSSSTNSTSPITISTTSSPPFLPQPSLASLSGRSSLALSSSSLSTSASPISTARSSAFSTVAGSSNSDSEDSRDSRSVNRCLRCTQGDIFDAGFMDVSDYELELTLHSLEAFETQHTGPLSGMKVFVEFSYDFGTPVTSTLRPFTSIGTNVPKEIVHFYGEKLRIRPSTALFCTMKVFASHTGIRGAVGSNEKLIASVDMFTAQIPVIWTDPSVAGAISDAVSVSESGSSSGSSSVAASSTTNPAAGGAGNSRPSSLRNNFVGEADRREFPMTRETQKGRLINSATLTASIAMVYRPRGDGYDSDSSAASSGARFRRRGPFRGFRKFSKNLFRKAGKAMAAAIVASAGSNRNSVSSTSSGGSDPDAFLDGSDPNGSGGSDTISNFADDDSAVLASAVQRTRTVKYIMSDPKGCLAIESQQFALDFPYNFLPRGAVSGPDVAAADGFNSIGYVVEVSTSTPEVSYGKSFLTSLQFCVIAVDKNHAKLRITQEMTFPVEGSPGSIIRNMIRKFATKGTKATYARFLESLQKFVAEKYPNTVEGSDRDSISRSIQLEQTLFPESLENELANAILPVSVHDLQDILFADSSTFLRTFFDSSAYTGIEIGRWTDVGGNSDTASVSSSSSASSSAATSTASSSTAAGGRQSPLTVSSGSSAASSGSNCSSNSSSSSAATNNANIPALIKASTSASLTNSLDVSRRNRATSVGSPGGGGNRSLNSPSSTGSSSPSLSVVPPTPAFSSSELASAAPPASSRPSDIVPPGSGNQDLALSEGVRKRRLGSSLTIERLAQKNAEDNRPRPPQRVASKLELFLSSKWVLIANIIVFLATLITFLRGCN